MTVNERGWRWWRFGVTIMAALVFSLQLYTLFSQLLERPTASSFTLLDEIPPRLPAVTVCPSLPFDLDTLINMGINSSCDNFDDCFDTIMELKGIPEDVSLQQLWTTSLLPLPSYVHSSSIHGVETTYSARSNAWPHWKVSNTSLGPCWTLTPPVQEAGDISEPLILNIASRIPCSIANLDTLFMEDPYENFPKCQQVEKNCNTSCITERFSYTLYELFHIIILILHSPHDPPAIVDASNTIAFYDSASMDVAIETWVSLRETQLIKSDDCISEPGYTFSKCLSNCLKKFVGKDFDCFHSHNNIGKQNKTCMYQFLQFRRLFLKMLKWSLDDTDTQKCKNLCLNPCTNTQYNFIVKRYPKYIIAEKKSKVYNFKMQMSAPYTESVVEEVIYTSSKFLSDLGGSLGLCFGLGLLTFFQYAQFFLDIVISWRNNLMYQHKGVANGHSYLKDVWMICGTCLCLMAFVVHSLQITLSYFEYSKVSVPSLALKRPPFPGLTLCPDVPFDLKMLFHYGLNVYNESTVEECHATRTCNRDLIISHLLNTLPGLWQSNLTAESIWNFARPFEAIVEDYHFDRIKNNGNVKDIFTNMGKCFFISPKEEDKNTFILDIFLAKTASYIEQENFFTADTLEGSSYSVMLLLSPVYPPPIFIGTSALTHSKHTINTLDRPSTLKIGAIKAKMISTPKLKCKEKPFSRIGCIHVCLLKEAAYNVGCRLPYLQDEKIPLCNTSSQYMKSFKGKNFKVLQDKMTYCKATCGIECEKVYYNIEPQTFNDGSHEKPDISLKKPSVNTLEITQQLKSSPLTLLSELGGIMGLYLGMSLLDFISWFLWPLRKVMQKVNAFHSKTSSHVVKLFQIVWFSFMSFLLLMFSLTRLQDFIINPKTYTKYSQQLNKWSDFPGISLCRWPPFNLTSLVSLGMEFDLETYCPYDTTLNEYVCTKDIYGYMNKLPGLENTSLATIWEQASWNLSDILHSYVINGNHFIIDSVNSSHWRSTVTSLNKCFTFIPPRDLNEMPHLELYLSRAGYQDYYRISKELTTEMALHYAMAKDSSIYRAHNLLRIHSPADEPKINNVDIEYPLYLNLIMYHMTLTTTLTKMSKLKTTYQKCQQNDTYSQTNCVQECLLQAVVHQEKCKLPFLQSFPFTFCNITKYMTFPKYLDKLSGKLNNYQKKNLLCTSKCLQNCNTFSYAAQVQYQTRLKTFMYPNKQGSITITMGKSTHDLYQEVPSLTWASFVAEIGGVAGILTGVSLLSLSQYLLTGLFQLISKMRNLLVRY